MPQVPSYTPYPTVEPTTRGTPSLRVEAPGAAFGENVGVALQHLGAVEEKAGNEIWQRAVALQDLRNETEATEADAKYMTQAGELHAKFSSLEGKAAVDAYPQYRKDLQDLRTQIRGNMSNDMARKLYDRSSLYTMGRSIFNGAGHAATQNKVYAVGAAEANAKAADKTVYDSAGDAADLNRALVTKRAATERIAAIRGWSPEKADEYYQDQVSSTISHAITGAAKNSPFKALEMLKQHEDQLNPRDAEQVRNTVESNIVTTGSRVIAERVNRDLLAAPDPKVPEKSLSDRLKEASDQADKFLKDSGITSEKVMAEFKPAVVKNVEASYRQIKAAHTDDQWRNRMTLDDALVTAIDGKVPTTVDELRARGAAASAAYDASDNKEAIRSKLLANARIPEMERRTYEQSDEGLRRRQVLAGMRYSSPGDFINVDMAAEKFTTATRKSFIDIQQKLKEQPGADPRVTRVMERLRHVYGADMEALGIYRHDKNDDRYDHFVGAVQEWLDQWHADPKNKNRQPEAKEIDQLGSFLMQQRQKEGIMGRWFGSTEPTVYEATIPAERREQITKEFTDRGLTAPTENELRRAYLREQLQLYYRSQHPTEAK